MIPEEIFELVGEESGPTSILLSGIHGNELCGMKIMQEIMPSFTIKRGRVLYGYGNPRAIEANVRFAEKDLNRMFMTDSILSAEDRASYEYRRAQYLKPYIGQADALLDIHAHPRKEQQTFAICESNAADIVRFLPAEHVVSGFDALEPGGTDYYMNSIGKIGICFECGYLDDEHSRSAAREAILAFLKVRGHIENDLVARTQSHVHIYKKVRSKTGNFKLSRPFVNFEPIAKGEIIGRDGAEAIIAPKKSVILFARDGHAPGSDVFLLGEIL
jgi:succinylglutamate desuccinylase